MGYAKVYGAIADTPEMKAWSKCVGDGAAALSIGPDSAELVAQAVMSLCQKEQSAVYSLVMDNARTAFLPGLDTAGEGLRAFTTMFRALRHRAMATAVHRRAERVHE